MTNKTSEFKDGDSDLVIYLPTTDRIIADFFTSNGEGMTLEQKQGIEFARNNIKNWLRMVGPKS